MNEKDNILFISAGDLQLFSHKLGMFSHSIERVVSWKSQAYNYNVCWLIELCLDLQKILT